VVNSAVYGHPAYEQWQSVLQEIFAAAHLPVVPISAHSQSSESTLYLHASKQWEYLFAWSSLATQFPTGMNGLKIADLGGGRGAWPAFLAKAGANVSVFDVNYLWDHGGDEKIEEKFLRWARDHGYNPRFGSMFNLPGEDGCYDIVSSISVIEHLRHNRYALKEALRILKPGGLLVLTFDFSLEPQKHQDELRQEIFSPQSLDQTLAALGLGPAGIDKDSVVASVASIQRDGVRGIPEGMTVGGVAIVKS
jgi:SAM-dependent methyltransferase